MSELRFTVLETEAGTRLDQLIAARAPELSRARAHQLIEEGFVRVQIDQVDSTAVKPALRVRLGSQVFVRIPSPRAVEMIPQDLGLVALYEDAHLIVIDKPAGIAVHPGAGGGGATLVHGLLHRIADLRGIGGELRPGIVHRLDKDTSGCLVVAKSEAALQGLQARFKAREVDKRYLAIAHGEVAESGEFDTLYARHPVDRKRFSSKAKTGKRAVTRWRLLARSSLLASQSLTIKSSALGSSASKSSAFKSSASANSRSAAAQSRGSNANSRGSGANPEPTASALEVDLLTGRTHQIRAHFSDAAHPLLGDLLYGGVKREGKLEDDSAVKEAARLLGRQALHAWVLEFQHPITGARVSCTSPIPENFRAALELLGIDAKTLEPALGADRRRADEGALEDLDELDSDGEAEQESDRAAVEGIKSVLVADTVSGGSERGRKRERKDGGRARRDSETERNEKAPGLEPGAAATLVKRGRGGKR